MSRVKPESRKCYRTQGGLTIGPLIRATSTDPEWGTGATIFQNVQTSALTRPNLDSAWNEYGAGYRKRITGKWEAVPIWDLIEEVAEHTIDLSAVKVGDQLEILVTVTSVSKNGWIETEPPRVLSKAEIIGHRPKPEPSYVKPAVGQEWRGSGGKGVGGTLYRIVGIDYEAYFVRITYEDGRMQHDSYPEKAINGTVLTTGEIIKT